MIEISDTDFRCNACESFSNVKYITMTLNGSNQSSSFRLCSKCREQFEKML